MSINNNPVLPVEATTVTMEAQTPPGGATPIERPGSQ